MANILQLQGLMSMGIPAMALLSGMPLPLHTLGCWDQTGAGLCSAGGSSVFPGIIPVLCSLGSLQNENL